MVKCRCCRAAHAVAQSGRSRVVQRVVILVMASWISEPVITLV